jgi:hypothetical protein
VLDCSSPLSRCCADCDVSQPVLRVQCDAPWIAMYIGSLLACHMECRGNIASCVDPMDMNGLIADTVSSSDCVAFGGRYRDE